MENRVLISGFGGQGVMLIGQLLGYASNDNDKYALFLPHYGPEQRGGTANCTVTLSDEEIGAPIVDKVDVLIAMNEPSLKKFQHRVKTNGVIFVNSSMCEAKVERDDVETFYIPVNDIATEIGSIKVANIVMLGAYIGQTGVLEKEQILETLKIKLAKKPEFIELNETALQKGIDIVNSKN